MEGAVGFHRLDMVMVIMPPAAHLLVNVFDFGDMFFHQIALKGGNPAVDGAAENEINNANII